MLTMNSQGSSDESNSNNMERLNRTLYDDKAGFKFPPPPRLTRSANNSCASAWSDSSNSDNILTKSKKRNKSKRLPPLGIFWDIENCQVPKNKSASAVVQRIRHFFLQSYREAEFVVVCDVKKEQPLIIQELHDSQVNLIHVSSTSKNAADEKLRQSLRRFAEAYSAPSAIVLISGDVNFAADLSDLRYRKKIRVILVHNCNAADALILCANDHYLYSAITEDLPEQRRDKLTPEAGVILEVNNLPLNCNSRKIKTRLKLLTDNCGGRVLDVFADGRAFIKFTTLDFANRAHRRIQGEDVYGNKIEVLTPSLRNYSGHRVKNNGDQAHSQNYPIPDYNKGGHQFSAATVNSNNYQQLPEYLRSYYNPNLVRAPPGFTQRQDSVESHSDGNTFRPIRGAHSLQAKEQRKNMGARPRTPQEMLFMGISRRTHTISSSSEFSDDAKTFQPIEKGNNSPQPVDLVVTNLDTTIEVKDLKKLLTNMFKSYVMILSLVVTWSSTDGSPIVNVQVSSQQEAQILISRFHRQKLGHKRIFISYAQNNSPNPEHLRSIVIKILQETPEKSMALFQFMNKLGSYYHSTVSVADITKLKDVCKISEEMGSRVISLNQEYKSSPTSNLNQTVPHFCKIHTSDNVAPTASWCELSTSEILNITMPLKMFSSKLVNLLNIHLGTMPFLSFKNCFEQEYKELLPMDDQGVPLEHLITCVPNVVIKFADMGSNLNIKIIKMETSTPLSDEEAFLKAIPPSLVPNFSSLCREMVDLLKTRDICQLPFTKFIPAYHNHFGRQCRVADYGFIKLLDLFMSISHIVQIIGDGTRRILTLSHAAQMRRFTSDVLRVLKVQPFKQIPMREFAKAYEKVMNKAFSAVDYGLCSLQDLLEEMPNNMVVITSNNEGFVVITVPKREQTAEQILKTKQFCVEVVELLMRSPHCTMLFDKFVPSYHHNFGYQCRVSDYGFTKLIDLFEAIPDVVKIGEVNGERTIGLTLSQALTVLGSKILTLIKDSNMSTIPLDDLPSMYLKTYGHPLNSKIYECDTVEQLILKLSDSIQVIPSNAGSLLIALETDPLPVLKVRVWSLLLNPPYCKELTCFKYEYQSKYNGHLTQNNLQQLRNIVSLSSSNDVNYISLTAPYVLAAQIYHVLYSNGGTVHYVDLETLLSRYYGENIKFADYNIHNLDEFYNNFNFLVWINWENKKCIIALNKNLLNVVPLPEDVRNCPWTPKLTPEELKKSESTNLPPSGSPKTPASYRYSGIENLDGDNFFINMPIDHNPTFLGDPFNLVSPAQEFININKNFWSFIMPTISSPDATELPLPDKLIGKGGGATSDDSADSGVNTKLENSSSDNEHEASAIQADFEFKGRRPNCATSLKFDF